VIGFESSRVDCLIVLSVCELVNQVSGVIYAAVIAVLFVYYDSRGFVLARYLIIN